MPLASLSHRRPSLAVHLVDFIATVTVALTAARHHLPEGAFVCADHRAARVVAGSRVPVAIQLRLGHDVAVESCVELA